MHPSKTNLTTLTEESTLSGKSRVGPLVAKKPAYAVVFEKRGIDYCCKGNKTLEELCDEKSLSVSDILTDLKQVQQPTLALDLNLLSIEELIVHIIEKHHNYLKNELPRLNGLITKVATKHGLAHPELMELQKVYNKFSIDLLEHVEKEESEVFPAILKRAASSIENNLEGLLSDLDEEHTETGRALEKMNELTNGYTPPKRACTSYLVMLDGLAALEKDIHEHVHKENHILFHKALNK